MKASRLLPLFGVLAVALIVVSFVVLGDTPDTDDSARKVASFYTEHHSDASATGALLMAAAAAFLIWAVQLRALLFAREGGAATRTTLGLVGSVVFAVGLAVFGGLNFALGDVPDKIDPAAVQALHVLNENLFPPLAVGSLLILFGNGLAVLTTRALPAWLGWVCIVAGIAALTPAWFVPFIGLAVLVLVSSALLVTGPDATARRPPAATE
jgi:hypothetical protein